MQKKKSLFFFKQFKYLCVVTSRPERTAFSMRFGFGSGSQKFKKFGSAPVRSFWFSKIRFRFGYGSAKITSKPVHKTPVRVRFDSLFWNIRNEATVESRAKLNVNDKNLIMPTSYWVCFYNVFPFMRASCLRWFSFSIASHHLLFKYNLRCFVFCCPSFFRVRF